MFHARKQMVAHEMMRKYADNPLVLKHPCLIPGFITLQSKLAEALRGQVTAGQASFPQWDPPGPWGDWKRLS